MKQPIQIAEPFDCPALKLRFWGRFTEFQLLEVVKFLKMIKVLFNTNERSEVWWHANDYTHSYALYVGTYYNIEIDSLGVVTHKPL